MSRWICNECGKEFTWLDNDRCPYCKTKTVFPFPDPEYPISLNDVQETLIKQWAADDRLWTTQETVEFNLRVFSRTIIKALSSSVEAAQSSRSLPENNKVRCDTGGEIQYGKDPYEA